MGKSRFNIDFDLDEVLWTDKKRTLPFGLPWTFTRYCMTSQYITITTGFFNKKEENIKLYKITDVTLTRSFFERLCKTGTICIVSSDVTAPEVHLIHIKESHKVKQIISKYVDDEKHNKNVLMTERNSPMPEEIHDFHCAKEQNGQN